MQVYYLVRHNKHQTTPELKARIHLDLQRAQELRLDKK